MRDPDRTIAPERVSLHSASALIQPPETEHALTFQLTPDEEQRGTVKCRACQVIFRDMLDGRVYGECVVVSRGDCELPDCGGHGCAP
jgi:hypothetical protein